MEFQFHPASGRGAVKALSLQESGQRVLVVLAAAAAVVAASLWVTAPVVAMRLLRREDALRVSRENRMARAEQARVAALAASLRRRAFDRGDLLNRIAFLYDIPPARWPRILNPERGLPIEGAAERIAAALEPYLRALERGRGLLADREEPDHDLPKRVPAILPFAGRLFEPSAFFGPRVSPWTGEEEFFSGVDIAAPAGSAVVAPGSGTVVFAGTVRRSLGGRFWQLGNLVVLSHGPGGATVFGHLSKIDVRRGQRISRGERLATVGATGWALSPQLHYEYWRPEGETLRPTDPLFAALDHRVGRKPLSLEQMQATSAPGPLDVLPGLGTRPAEGGAGRAPSGPGPSPHRRSHRRRI